MKKLTILLLMWISVIISFNSCTPVEPVEPEAEFGDTLWTSNILIDGKTPFIDGHFLAVSPDESTIYCAANLNYEPTHIIAINRNNGSIKWVSEPLDNGDGIHTNIVVADDGTIYAGCSALARVYCINPGDGTIDWVYVVPEKMHDSEDHEVVTNGSGTDICALTLTNENNLVFKTAGPILLFTHGIYCITPEGELKWYGLGLTSYNDIVIGHDGTMYSFEDYFTGEGTYTEERLTAVNAENGTVKWVTAPTINNGGMTHIMVNKDDNILYKTADTLYCVDTRTHQYKWKMATSNGFYGSRIIEEDMSGNIFCNTPLGYIINPDNGQEIKSAELPWYPIIDSKNRIVGCGSDAHPELVLKNQDGEELWNTFPVGIMPNHLITTDNKIYAFGGDATLYAWQYDASMAHTSWPRPTHDNRNTNNVNKW